jgi:hypothetical protein
MPGPSGTRSCCPVEVPPAGRYAAGWAPDSYYESKSLYLVFKCVLSTKHSGAHRAWQGLFDPHSGAEKTVRKTVFCRPNPGPSRSFPPAIHRLVHRMTNRQTAGASLQFRDNPSVTRRNIAVAVATVNCPRASAHRQRRRAWARATPLRLSSALRQQEEPRPRDRHDLVRRRRADQRQPGQAPELRQQRCARQAASGRVSEGASSQRSASHRKHASPTPVTTQRSSRRRSRAAGP